MGDAHPHRPAGRRGDPLVLSRVPQLVRDHANRSFALATTAGLPALAPTDRLDARAADGDLTPSGYDAGRANFKVVGE
ncbi:hypothetical protein GCM10010201_30880 [Pilimelia columellifera subsp. columellifera]|uniref:Uncharacterized protein n=1 Tax=Pilimelia columellifera subsp. columellifera TaxID=706583 RepID=A0ABP6AZG8_9ACTN